MKHCVASVLLFTLTGPLCAQTHWIGKIGDEHVSVVIPQSTLLKQPGWNPRDSSTPAPPIALHTAVDLAKQALWNAHPTFKDMDWNYSISLDVVTHGINDGTHVIDAKGREWIRRERELVIFGAWVYCIRFSALPPVVSQGPTYPGPRFPVAVLFDGSVILPTNIEKQKIDTIALHRDYDPVLNPQTPALTTD